MITGACELHASVAQADVAIPGDDHVVEERDVEETAGAESFGSQPEVVGRRRRIPRRVVVYEQDRRGVKLNCSAEEFAYSYERGRDVPLVQAHLVHNDVSGIQDQDVKLLAVERSELKD